MKTGIKVLILLLLSSCVIEINENGYRSLTDEAKRHVRPFTIDLLNQKHNYRDSIILYEISSRDLKQIIKKNKYTWVHFWAPHCSSKSCINVTNLMNEVEEKEKQYDFAELLISTEYDFENLKQRLNNSKFTQPVFILTDSIYGHKNGKALRLFASEIDNNNLINKNKYFGEYFFCDTLLTVATWNLTPQQIDSIVKNKKNYP